MKRYIFTLFALMALLLNLTGCGGSSSSDYVAGSANGGMATVRVSLRQNGAVVTDAESVVLYTSAAAMREGISQNENASLGIRASAGASGIDGVYRAGSVDAYGCYEFNVPADDYVLVATNGITKAVVSGIRAAAGGDVITATLTPTGKIIGKVTDGTTAVTGAMVYLVNTSCVAFSRNDGLFEMTGVPTGNQFDLAAICTTGNRYMVSEVQQVTVDSSLIASLTKDIVVKEKIDNIMNITGCIVDTKGNGVAGKAIMAVNGNIMAVGVSGSDGNFAIPVKISGTYSVSSINSATPAVQSVTVNSEQVAVDEKFVIAGVTGQPGAITGKIALDSSLVNAPSADDFLVRLVGSGTYYNTSIKVGYNPSNTNGYQFTFSGIPAGTYGILVDPSGNGFLGSKGDITVTEGNITDISSEQIIANYIRPDFNVSWAGNVLTINSSRGMDNSNPAGNFSGPVSYASLRYYGKDRNEAIDLNKAVCGFNDSGKGITANYDFGGVPEIASKTFDCVFSITKPWSDPVTKLSGSLIVESGVFTHTDDFGFGANVRFCKVLLDDNYVIRNSDGSFTSWSSDNCKYYENLDVFALGAPTFTYEVNNILGASQKTLLYQDDEGNLLVENKGTGTNAKQVGTFANVNILSANIIANKYITVTYTTLDYSGGDASTIINADIYSLDSDTPAKIDTIKLGETSDVGTYMCGNVAEDDSGNVYTILLKFTGTDALHNMSYEIYKLSGNSVVNVSSGDLGSADLSVNDIAILEFNCLSGGRFYFETSLAAYSSVIVNGSGILEKSISSVDDSTSRSMCFSDKYGHLYRLQNVLNYREFKIILVDSLDGKPLASTSGPSSSSEKIEGLVCVYTDSSTGETVCCYLGSGV